MEPEIPLVDLKAQYRPLRDDILSRIDSILDGMHLFLGENVQAFESAFAEYCGVKSAVGVGNGTDALQMALRACGVGPGDEVITVANTFFATVEAIALAGARPVFVDVRPDTHTMDPSQVERRITRRTRAIVPVDLYGQPADMVPILGIARAHRLKVIEDACQAHGALYGDRRAGGLADVAAFSFYFSKNLGAYGEAGAVTTDDPEIAERVRQLRNHGSTRRYHHDLVGTNSRIDEIQAAVLLAKLPHLDDWNEQRRRLADRYNRLLAGAGLGLPVEDRWAKHVYHLYVIRSPERDALTSWLGERGIATGIHYPVPCHLQPAAREWGMARGMLPVTERLAGEILSLPMYAELTEAQQSRVVEAILDFQASRVAQPVIGN